MDSSGSSGNEASGYGSDNNKYNADDSQLSDWDDDSNLWGGSSKTKDKEKCNSKDGVKTELHLEVGSDIKKQQEALFDSGYQKSPSVPDESPPNGSLPVINEQQPIALGFEYLNNHKPNKLSNILSVFDNFDKINELDAFRKERMYFNFSSNVPHREVMKKICQEIAKHPVAGPSRETRRSRPPKKSSGQQSSDSEDSTDEVKSITTCIIENSLNKIECQNEERPKADFIQELVPVEEEYIPAEEAEAAEPLLIVENGDLANNNRDLEGNNYPPGGEQNQVENVVDNMERNNINFDNNNEVADNPVPEEQPDVAEENVQVDLPVHVDVAWSSREALFDINSQVDLLEDFEMDAFPENSAPSQSNDVATEAVLVLPVEDVAFPNWLLEIFQDGDVDPEEELHDEPHFYCQGVHPSIVAVNVDDEDDDDDDDDNRDTESGSNNSSSSSSGSVEFQSAENQSFQGTVADNSRNDDLVLIGQPVATVSEQNDATQQIGESSEQEVFENAEESESNLLVTSTQ